MDNQSITLFVPGRLCLFGEHSDWAGLHRIINADITPGAAIVTGIEQGIFAKAEKSEKFIMHNESLELKNTWVDFESSMQLNELRSTAESESYFSYAAGVASYIKEHYSVGGVKITITDMTLPMKKGLSSSAAICVLVARAFNLLYNLNLNTRGEMDIAFKGEQRTKSRCGRLDQACAYGVVPVCMNFNGDDITVERLVVKNNFYWVFADLNSKKDTIKILSDLNKCFPFADNEKEKKVHEALGEINQQVINRAIEYLRMGNAVQLGKLMTEAQNVFDSMVAPACPEELTSPVLHSFLDDEKIKSLTLGAKGVGSQGDGSIQFLTKDADTQEKLCNYLSEKGLTPFKFTIKPQRRIKKAIIPIAGFGTRLYPATRTIKKEMLPIPDRDGRVKPAILILLEQLQEAGIEEICLVVGSDEDIKFYKKFFNNSLSEEHYGNLSEEAKSYEQTIKEIGEKICFRIQKEKKGFGHAVFQARDFASGEPTLLILADQIYSSTQKYNCTRQLIEFYEEIEKPLIALTRIPKERVNNYGILSGKWTDTNKKIMDIKNFTEKPDINTAQNTEGAYYAVFGQYVLPYEIFEVLRDNVNDAEDVEIDMTRAFNEFIGKGLTGVLLDGNMYDIGNPYSYREAFYNFKGNQ